jgi:DNA-binding PadR family transcriptional regulator
LAAVPVSATGDESVFSLTEYAVLGLAAEGWSYGFAIAREMGPDGEIGGIYRVARPAVYRAVERLLDAGVLKALSDEPGNRGPRRTPLSVTPRGRRRLDAWLGQPVGHIRELRTTFLVKLVLVDRAGSDPRRLIASQIDVVRPIVTSIEEQHRGTTGRERSVSTWRTHSARAALDFLVELAAERA